MNAPSIVVLSSLFPHGRSPTAGIFVRERMFRVGQALPLAVVSPQAWWPGQSLLRRWRPGYRLEGDQYEQVDGFEVFRPRAWCAPGIGRRWDGRAMAAAARPVVARLLAAGRCAVIDAHFAYPDGYAASLLARRFGVPYTVTLRGTEPRHLLDPALRWRIREALNGAARVFTVSNSLREIGIAAGVPPERFEVVGNGVDSSVFHPMARDEARRQLGLRADARVLCTIGALVERKGFHRVLALMPEMLKRMPDLVYLIVGGASPEGDWTERLHREVEARGLGDAVRFLGPLAPRQLRVPLSASDVFVLPSSNEGWANVILEAMACGVPVVASDVGGNAEVVCDSTLGSIYPFTDESALRSALEHALSREWDRAAILAHAQANTWDTRVVRLVAAFRSVAALGANPPMPLDDMLTTASTKEN